MSEPVTVAMPLELMREIRDTLQGCAEDLEAEAEANYPEALRKQYPTYARRYARDMEPANKAAMLVQAINMQPWAYGVGFNRKGGRGWQIR